VLVLFTAMGASSLMGQRGAFENAASHDKDFVVVEGLLHGIIPCGFCGASERECQRREEPLRLHPAVDQ
jgi:hypothetical protein